jgi:hypothetical protein
MNRIVLFFALIFVLHLFAAIFLVLTNHHGWLYPIFRNIFYGTILITLIDIFYLFTTSKK